MENEVNLNNTDNMKCCQKKPGNALSIIAIVLSSISIVLSIIALIVTMCRPARMPKGYPNMQNMQNQQGQMNDEEYRPQLDRPAFENPGPSHSRNNMMPQPNNNTQPNTNKPGSNDKQPSQNNSTNQQIPSRDNEHRGFDFNNWD